ncbi:cell wall-binding repeat-containing protein [Leifsonia sp. P73]|uniref:cell wall-binding repeat-containing protein n=1 Tax=Leifsonia sp. P73 TaxID=3423959 RepID=UPI003DA314E9
MVSGGKRTAVRLIVTSVIALAVAVGTAVPATAANDAGGGSGGGGFDQPSAAQLQKNLEEGLRDSFSPSSAADADLSKFVDGDLISDAVFYNGSAWNQTRIQSFLDMKATNNGCVTGSDGSPCLNVFTTTTPSKAGGAACNAYTGVTNATAAQIISGVGLACGINPVVLIAMIQKEEGLVSTGSPTQWMYDHATGWNCPDKGADPSCDSSPTSTGFFNQVYGAAWQLKEYGVDTATFNNYPVGKVSPVLYSTTSSCGTKQIAIQNKATSALYTYTPYTPNAASLANYPGEGDACSEYGIRNFWYLFNAWYDGPSTAGSVPAISRLSGADRFATSVAISQAAFPTPGAGIQAAYIASGYTFPDALAAAPAAVAMNGPLLLTGSDTLPASVSSELQRLNPQTIYVAGGPASVTDGVVAALGAAVPGATVTRIAGADRFETSRDIASNAYPTVSTAYLASGMNFPDALSAGAAAGAQHLPVILVGGDAPDAAIIDTLHSMSVTNVKLIGGTAVIHDSYASGLSSAGFTVTRVAGADRFRTSLAVNADAFPSATAKTLYASAAVFPDALSGAAYAGRIGSPLLVTPADCVISGAAELSLRSSSIGLLGGTASLTDAVGALSICQ